MAEYQIKGRNITLTADPEKQTYAVEIAGQRWTMTDKPYVQFENGERMEFHARSAKALSEPALPKALPQYTPALDRAK